MRQFTPKKFQRYFIDYLFKNLYQFVMTLVHGPYVKVAIHFHTYILFHQGRTKARRLFGFGNIYSSSQGEKNSTKVLLQLTRKCDGQFCPTKRYFCPQILFLKSGYLFNFCSFLVFNIEVPCLKCKTSCGFKRDDVFWDFINCGGDDDNGEVNVNVWW